MSRVWTSTEKPPHPSTIPSLSPLASRIIHALEVDSLEKQQQILWAVRGTVTGSGNSWQPRDDQNNQNTESSFRINSEAYPIQTDAHQEDFLLEGRETNFYEAENNRRTQEYGEYQINTSCYLNSVIPETFKEFSYFPSAINTNSEYDIGFKTQTPELRQTITSNFTCAMADPELNMASSLSINNLQDTPRLNIDMASQKTDDIETIIFPEFYSPEDDFLNACLENLEKENQNLKSCINSENSPQVTHDDLSVNKVDTFKKPDVPKKKKNLAKKRKIERNEGKPSKEIKELPKEELKNQKVLKEVLKCQNVLKEELKPQKVLKEVLKCQNVLKEVLKCQKVLKEELKPQKVRKEELQSQEEVALPKKWGEKQKSVFVVPYKKSVSSLNIPEINVVDLNSSSIQDLEAQILSNAPIEVGIMMILPESSKKKFKAEGVMLRICWEIENIEFCYIHGDSEYWKDKVIVKTFFQTLLVTNSEIYCCGAQQLLIFLLSWLKLDERKKSSWRLSDPLIAHWLIKSDEPCCSFEELLMSLGKSRDSQIDGTPKVKACRQLQATAHITKNLNEELKDKGLWELYMNIEQKLIAVLASMELRGININTKKLKEMGTLIDKSLKKQEQNAYQAAGKKFQLNSPLQLRKVLYDELKLDVKFKVVVKGTLAAGAKSTSEPILRKLAQHHELPKIILNYRRLKKVKSTYVDGILNCVIAGKVRSSWEQTSAATGRITSANPNLQTIPRHAVVAEDNTGQTTSLNLRSPFEARPGYTLISADFQHLEFRIFAHLSQDDQLIQIFNTSEDVFVMLTKFWLGEGMVVQEDDRDKTKKVVYAFMYGAGTYKIVELLNLPQQDVTKILTKLTSTFTGLKHLQKEVVEKCRRDGYLATMTGRRRQFPDINSTDFAVKAQAERQALNFVIQGTAADLCKRAMLATEDSFEQDPTLDVHLLLQIHDELVWEVRDDQVATVIDVIKKVMEDSTTLDVPIQVRTKFSKTWDLSNECIKTDDEEEI